MTGLVHRLRARRGEEGLSIIEIMLAMVIMLLVAGAVQTTLGALVKHDAQVRSSITSLDSGETALNVITKDVHAATAPTMNTAAFTVATATSATFTASLGGANGPDQITISETGTGATRTLLVTRKAATAGSAPNYTWTGTTYYQVKLAGLNANPTTPLLSYFDATGAALTGSFSLASVASVSVSIDFVTQGQHAVLTAHANVYNVMFQENAS